jgi:hypothetical protein
MNIYISIGSNCTTAGSIDSLQIKKESLPFDWMFSTPLFVYTILKLLLIDKKDINDIVDNHFFICDERAISLGHQQEPAHYINTPNGNVLINSKYNVAFPHDLISDRDKYIRRLERLKKIILDESVYIYFVYVSIPRNNYFRVNDVEPIEELYEYIEKINNILKDIRNTYKIIVFDTNKSSGIIPSDNLHLIYYDIEKKNCWTQLIPEVHHNLNNLINNKVIDK